MIIQVSQLVATTAIAIFAAVIAYGQWLTARQKLRLDLFEKRYEVYRIIRAYIQLSIDDKARIGELDFESNIYKLDFLFGEDVQIFIQSALAAQNDRLALIDLLRKCSSVFGPYIDFRNIKP